MLVLVSLAHADERYIFLGDSLADNQNSFIATTVLPFPVVPASPPYFEGRFSNGPNWTDMLAPAQNFYMDYFFSQPNCQADNAGTLLAMTCGSTQDPGQGEDTSLGFAFGGAQAGTEVLPSAPGMLTVLNDLRAYSDAGVVASTAGATFAILVGGNDYTNFTNGGGLPAAEGDIVAGTLDKIQTGLGIVTELGAKRAIVVNLFDLASVPTLAAVFDADQLAQSGRLSALHNAQLPAMLDEVRQQDGLDVVLVDMAAMYQDINADPATYGFSNTTGSCLKTDGSNEPSGECPDAQSEAETLFWDGQHPTTAAHGQIYNLVTATLQAVDDDPGRFLGLADSGLMQLRNLYSAVRSQLDDPMGLSSPVGASSATHLYSQEDNERLFIVLDNGSGRRGRDGEFSGYGYRSTSAVMGFSVQPEHSQGNLLLGGHLGYIALDGSFSGGSSFDNAAIGAGGFGSWRKGDVSLRLQTAVMHLSLESERNTGFDALPKARGQTEGWAFGGELELRLDNLARTSEGELGVAGFTRLSAGRANVDGFSERNARFLNLGIDDSDATELRAGIGISSWTDVSVGAGRLQPHITVSYDRDLIEDRRHSSGSLPSGQAIAVDTRLTAKHLYTLSSGIRYIGSDHLTLELAVSMARGSQDEEMDILPRLAITKHF